MPNLDLDAQRARLGTIHARACTEKAARLGLDFVPTISPDDGDTPWMLAALTACHAEVERLRASAWDAGYRAGVLAGGGKL